MALWTNVDNEAGKPKFLSSTEKSATVGVSAAETANAKATHAGWVLSTTGTGGREGRVFNETLVAMGSITGDSDSIAPNTTTITITEQPGDQTVATGDAASFAVDYISSNETITPTHVWQVSTDGTTWTTIAGETSFDLEIASTDPEYVDGNQFRAVVSATGADTVTSDAATLTITV